MLTKEIIGYLAATITTAGFIPQVLKAFKTKQTNDVSLWMYIILLTGLILWLIYGICIHDWPVILANIATILLVLTMLILKYIYR